MKRLLLHTCCGPCFFGSFEGLKDEKFKITSYFYNPNIQPKEEWEKRLQNLQIAAEGKTEGVITENYDPENHVQAIIGKEDEFPKRCLDCYRLRLKKTAQKAKEEGFDLFSTTLLISPYQQHDALRGIGDEVGKEFGVSFYYKDLRPYFKEGQEIAKEKCIYRQKYCGCLYSKEYK